MTTKEHDVISWIKNQLNKATISGADAEMKLLADQLLNGLIVYNTKREREEAIKAFRAEHAEIFAAAQRLKDIAAEHDRSGDELNDEEG